MIITPDMVSNSIKELELEYKGSRKTPGNKVDDSK